MRKLFFILLTVVSAHTFAQQLDYPIDTIDGKIVYRYEVQKAEGLYRISKNFNVSQEDILRLNPVLQTQGLKLGQKIFIPVVQAIDTTQFIVHIIQPKETLYGLSRQYGVKVTDLQALNPELATTMTIGKPLLIAPKPAATPATEPSPEPVAPAVEAAPEPVKPVVEPAVEPVVEPAPEPTSNSQIQNPRWEEAPAANSQFTASSFPLRLAFLLPFMTDAPKRDANMDRFVDFYEGALLAIYNAQLAGQHFDIYAYDVQKSDVHVQQTLQRSELLNVDAIIGPAYPAQVNYTALFAKQNRIPVLIPFTSKVSGIEYNPYLLQFNPSVEQESAALTAHLKPRRDSVRFVLIQGNGEMPATSLALQKAAIADSFEVVTTSVSQILADSLQFALADGKENLLIFPSDKWASVNVLMPNILQQKAGHQLTICGHYAWAEETCLLPMLYTTIFHALPTDELAAYDQLYQQYFGHDHAANRPRYDLLGYDVTRALILLLQHSQSLNTQAERDALYAQLIKGLQTDIQFAPAAVSAQSGKVNTAIQVIRK